MMIPEENERTEKSVLFVEIVVAKIIVQKQKEPEPLDSSGCSS